ncbi:glycosyltransferase family 4 protein [Pedobacter hiemivivus]|uniref:Glycosyltransferase family 4 protein n=1 Tax=Pedobacter hiemivivus TaxID=2530454 RepID=A0A4U1FXQ4_9SPHI|nr:glycosyltransferase family 1 protein [Pedobacter hiemivivus]TKC55817.1 glycosyltransferase family 4 protein [Pedobacter hiemivivus]
MKYPYTGLFEYCHQLGLALLETKSQGDNLGIYLQRKDQHYFPADLRFLDQKSLHKFIFPKFDVKIDIWHCTHQTSWYMPPSNRKVKRVLTIHDLNFLYEEKSEAKRISYLKKHQKNIDLADHIVAISEFTKNDVIKHLKVDKPITVIYNGCNVAKFPEYDRPTYQPSRPFLFTLGTVNAKKNFHSLPCLVKNRDLDLIIAGKIDEGYVAQIMEEAVKHQVQDQVKILGPVSNEDKYWYYKNCQAFVFPSLAEGFGIPVIEAMNFGKPVFLSKATSLPEIGGKLAYYFDDFNYTNMNATFDLGINHYATSHPEEAIIAHANQFNWMTSALKYWEVYHSLLLS